MDEKQESVEEVKPVEAVIIYPTEVGAYDDIDTVSGKINTYTKEERQAVFELYAGLGPGRSFDKVAGMTGISVNTLRSWSARYNWAVTLELRLCGEALENVQLARQEAAKNSVTRLRNAQLLQQTGIKILRDAGFFDSDPIPQDIAKKMARMALRMILEGAGLERAEAMESIPLPPPEKSFEEMTDTELDEFIKRFKNSNTKKG